MKTVRMKRNIGAFIAGQKVTVMEERKDGLYLRGVAVFDLKHAGELVIQGPVKIEDVEEENAPRDCPLCKKHRGRINSLLFQEDGIWGCKCGYFVGELAHD